MTVPLERMQIVRAMLEDVQVAADDVDTPRAPVPACLLSPPPGGAPLSAARPAADRRPLEAVLRSRTAARVYGDEPLTIGEVGAVLAAAAQGDATSWDREHRAGLALDLVLVAWRVTGLGVATHLYRSKQHALHQLAPVPYGQAAQDLVLQREFARAAALVVVTGPLGGAIARHGTHGHRTLLLRAGAAAHRAWLAAESLDLVGCIFAGLLPQAVRELAAADGFVRAPLLAFALGRRPVRPGHWAGADTKDDMGGPGLGQTPLPTMRGRDPVASSTLV